MLRTVLTLIEYGSVSEKQFAFAILNVSELVSNKQKTLVSVIVSDVVAV